VIWNLDFWGKYRRQTEAARPRCSQASGHRAVISSLVANVATAYFQLRALDSQLEISKRTLASRQQSLKLTEFLESHGSNSGLDVSQSQQLVYTASETIPDLERQIQQQENLLSILLGENPGSINRGRALTEQPVPESFPLVCLQNCSNVARTFGRQKKYRGSQRANWCCQSFLLSQHLLTGREG